MATLRAHVFRAKSAPSALPSLIIPCPRCGGRMTAISARQLAFVADTVSLEEPQGLENIAHGCARCGTELIRTVICEPHD